MRHVIPKDEVCAAWVKRDRIYAHTPSSNLSFDNFDRLYSYATVIASRVTTPEAIEVIFVTKHTYSTTTTQQLSSLNYKLREFRAIMPVIYVPGAAPYGVLSVPPVWKELVEEAQGLWKQAQRARSRRDSIISEGNAVLKTANRLVELFGYGVVDGTPLTTLEDLQETMRIHEAHLKLRA